MSSQTIAQRFASELLEILDETFEQVHGIYLDRGTSLFETLATITATEASRPVGTRCASIAGQVKHVTYYLEVLAGYMQQQPPDNVDWQASWQIGEVSPDEWAALVEHLRATYQRVLALIKSFDTWDGEDDIAGSLAIVVHTAYHLGEIRQALCIVR